MNIRINGKRKKNYIYLKKRDQISMKKSIGIRIIAIIMALIFCALIIIPITHLNPLQIYLEIINGAIGNKRRIWVTIKDILILFIISVGLVPAYKMKFWNIGAEGQILMGGVATAAAMIYYGDYFPNWLLLVIIFIVSSIAGMIWGVIPAIFKAYFNTNETLFTLMMNYIAIQIVAFCVIFWEKPKGSNTVGIINSATKQGWFPPIFNLTYGMNIILVLIITILVFIYLKYTKHGYEIAVVGSSINTAKYININVKKVIIRTMALSGAICGLAGSIIVSGASHTISTATAGGRGFTAIIVAWMSKFHPVAMIFVSGLLIFMEKGSIQIASLYGLNENASDIITGIIIFFLIGCEFFINYEIKLKKD
ncbi:ABC transporter permease [Defluviitalea phaphyphila]|uniref:ABC transporter permease n=1 Tax=Defluviitalea phaphyphila TaxID=1473580 RepID=UPI0007319610|nr:ABC transporter permease [Defluviitalea phaphyphila]